MLKRIGGNVIKGNNKSIIFKMLVILIALFVIFLVGLYINTDRVSADYISNRSKQVVSVKIKKGDTLWDIAKEYMTEEYNDINEYIQEIKLSNGLYSDTIHEGSYLIVPYYAEIDSNIRLTSLEW